MTVSYKDAGVDIDAGNLFVSRIKKYASKTRIPEQLSGLGGFGGLCAIPAGYDEPILVSGTDGVGTKLKIAQQLNKHDTVGIDLVAMCVNDILTCGAKPLFFLDYLSTDKLDIDVCEALISGIAEGCLQAGCSLLGGETAEHPGSAESHYDLAGFTVGVVDKKKIIDGSKVRAGDVIIALPSSGLHSNGYSLARHVLIERAGLSMDAMLDGLDMPLGETLLTPTKIYVKTIVALLKDIDIHALCHITGGGLDENLPRVLPDVVRAEIDYDSWSRPAIFSHIQKLGPVEEYAMRRTFNLGVGMAVIVKASDATNVLNIVQQHEPNAWRLGEIVKR